MIDTATAPQSAAPRVNVTWTITAAVIGLFFIWGGVTSLNDILIPKLKGLFQLSYMQAMFVQLAFFTAYAVVSLPAGWLVSRLGYGKGIVTGLVVMAAGCLIFVPAAAHATYALFLCALFVLASGVTILQVAANPLIASLGSVETSHSRLTLAQAFNALGTTVWPFVGAQIILGSLSRVDPATLSGAGLMAFQAEEARIISDSYVGIAIALGILALLFWLWRRQLQLRTEQSADVAAGGLSLLRERRLSLGVLGIFLYVGAEVSIGSVLISYLMQPSTMHLDERTAGGMIALYWGGAMVGRFIGAALLRVVSAGKLLCAAAIGAACLVILSASSGGVLAGGALIAVGLMNAIMFPTIFSLSLEGLGDRTPKGSGLLCMAIVGGAIVPVAMGSMADAQGLSTALLLPAACYAFIAFFGWYAHRPRLAAPMP